MNAADPYLRTEDDVRAAPTAPKDVLRYLGPGLIITGSIVGSGELIMTTQLGAQVGFTFLWFIILSCVIKVVVQIELGRYCISSGKTTLEGFNQIPGPRLFNVSWLVWWWFLMFCATLLQVGGIVSGIGQTLHPSFGDFPALSGVFDADPERNSVACWSIVTAITGIFLLVRGRYSLVERITTLLVCFFTLTTVANVGFVQATDFAIRGAEIWEGLKGHIPDDGLLIAFGVFGITGVGASELIYYPYWCLEKGYARFCGPTSDASEWAARSKGWIRILRIDAWLAMVIYTLATIAFYLLGAAVLHGRTPLPEKDQMMSTLSEMYRTSFPTAGYVVFLVGAFVVLYSTFFVSAASLARVLTDFVHIVGRVNFRDARHRANWTAFFVVLLPILWCLVAIAIPGQPVVLVTIGAVAQALTLPPIAAAAIYLRYKRTDRRVAPNIVTDLFLWIAAAGMWTVSAYQLFMAVADALPTSEA